MQRGPREVAYSYLSFKEWIKVSSLSKGERENVLNSKIIKENDRKQDPYVLVKLANLTEYSNDVALKGLLIAIQLSKYICL